MKISELSTRSGVPIATIKYYLREGLLSPGSRSSATQAIYSDAHLSRLMLIRSLVGSAGLSIEQAKRVLDVIDDPPRSMTDTLGAVQEASTRPTNPGRDPAEAVELIERLGWSIDADSEDLARLDVAMRAVSTADVTLVDGGLERYAQLVHELAEDELKTVPSGSLEAAVRQVVLGTILLEPVILALRRLAQQDVARQLFDPKD